MTSWPRPPGRLVAVTYPDGTASTQTFDEAGRMTGQADLSASGTVLRSASAAYDGDGNMLSATDYCGNTTTYTYDPTGAVASESQPVTASSSVTTSFGYDLSGNRTLFTDGNGNNWWATYNSWNLPESQIEPSTAAYSSPAQGTFTAAYDANGRLAAVTQPGGVTLADTYNSVGELTGQSGGGADAATATRSFGYDLAGDMTSASTPAAGPAPATSESFTYNDRGLPLSASGSGGSSSFTYNGDGAPVSVTDAAGTTSYTYDMAGRLATLADPLTGTTAAYSYSPMSQVSQISYGSGNDVRTFGYSNLHQLTSDTLTTAGGASVASISYGYDLNGNLTSKTTAGFAGSAANTYTYDEANRLTSWNNGSTATDYSYDGAGNRTGAGSQTLTYDARDELASSQPGSGGATTFSYTARGTMSSAAGPNGTQSFASDAYGQGVTQAGQQYTYDALGRVLAGSGNGESFSFGYDGTGSQITADGTWHYSYDPGGGLAAAGPSSGPAAQGVVAYTDAHTDVTGDFSPPASSLTGSAAYDPFGNVLASSGLAGNLGYQSGFTDPASKLVHMGARWYWPADGQFTSRDSVTVSPVPDEAAASPFAYAADNPLTSTDPTGHFLAVPGGGGTARAPVRHYYSPPPPPARSCGGWPSWLAPGCLVHHVGSMYSHAVNGYHRAVQFVTHAARVVYGGAYRALQRLRALKARAVHFAGHLARAVQAKIADAASWGYHAAVTAWDTGVSIGTRVAHAVTRWARPGFQKTIDVLSTAFNGGPAAQQARLFHRNGNLMGHLGIEPTGPTAGLYRDMTRSYAGGWRSFLGGMGQPLASLLDLASCASDALQCAHDQATGSTYSASYLHWLHSQGVLTGASSWFGAGAGTTDFITAMLGSMTGGTETAATSITDLTPEDAGSTLGEARAGQTVYRVWGRDPTNPDLAPNQSGPWGRSWTRADPASVAKYRDVAGLPNEANLGRFVSQGILHDTTGVVAREAVPLGENVGGLDELFIPNPGVQVRLTGVYGVNPPF